MSIDAISLGLTDYRTAWNLQNSLAAEIAAGTRPPTLLFLEHPHTYTIGRRGGQNHLLWDAASREAAGVSVIEVDRGGDITYHGPGQLVGYPLLRLAQPGWQGERLPQADFVGYIRKLEDVLITALAGFGIQAVRRPGLTGVWVPAHHIAGQPGKIASIGVKVDVKGISRHGFALNVNPDMTYWQGIVACGIDRVQMVSIADFVSPAPSMPAVIEQTVLAFSRIFSQPIHWITSIEEGAVS